MGMNALEDRELGRLAYLAEGHGEIAVGIGVTLNCGGQIIYGTLCSYRDWLNRQAGALDQGPHVDVNAMQAAVFLAKDYRTAAAAEASQDGSPGFIHMVDAMTERGAELGSWRGQIAMVSGWSLGQTSRS